jgi:hypothetical protein
MAELSKYEDAAKAFLKKHPLGSVVTPEKVLDWAEKFGDGLASDMLVSDPSKKISALRRHLNDGAASRNLAEANRFHLAIEDAKRKTMRVVSLADHVKQQADQAIDKSIVGALSPINRSQKAIDDIKLEEVENEELRQELERQLAEMVEAAVPLKRVLSQQLQNHWIGKLEAKGLSRQEAQRLIEMAPTVSRLGRLMRYTA